MVGSALPFWWSQKLGGRHASILCKCRKCQHLLIIYVFPIYNSSWLMKQFLHAFLSPAEPGALIPILMTRNESRTQRLEGGRSGGG